MSAGRLLAVLLFSTLVACPGGSPKPPDPQSPALPSTSLGESTVGAPFSRSFAASGGAAPLSYSAQGLPAGIALDSQTGSLSGSPASVGSFDIDASVTDAAGRSDQRRYALLVLEAPHFVTASLPPATLTVSYAARIEATGGKTPLVYGVSGGSLPPGLTVDASGTLSGVPSAAGTYSFELSVTDAHGAVKRAPFTLQVRHAPPVFVTAELPSAIVSRAYHFAVSASGGTPPYSWSTAEGELPQGLSLSTSGELSGTPSVGGTASFALEVRDANGQSAQKAFSLTVIPALVFTTTSLPDAYRGSPYLADVKASGGVAPYSYSLVASPLPAGVQFDTQGHFAGTPSISGVFGITLTLQDASQQSLTRAFGLTVYEPPSFASSTLRDGVVGLAYSDTLQASGGKAPFTFRLSSGALPAGLQLSGGAITGKPTTPGIASFTLEILDANGHSGTQAFTLRVVDALAITSSTPPDAYTDAPYAHALTATGGRPPYRWALVSGALPAGISLSASGQLSGTPSAAGGGSFTVSVSDADDTTATKTLSVTAYAPPAISAVPAQNAYVSDVINSTLTVTGGKAPYLFSSSGSLPPGLSLGSSTGLLQGTLTTPGSFSFGVTASDSNSRTSSRAVSFTVHTLPAITSTTLPEGDTGQSYSSPLAATGGQGTLSWSVTGTLPPGLTLSSTGLLSGTPTTAGSYSFTARVTDAGNRTASRTLTLVIQGPPTVTTAGLADGYVDSPYSATLTASGGRGALSWTFSGSLPPGLNLSTGGALSGTPTFDGSFSFTVIVTDSLGRPGSRSLSLTVYRPPYIATSWLNDAYVSEFQDVTLIAWDGKPPYTFSVASGALPAGLSLTSSGRLFGTPTTPGLAQFEIAVTDANGRTGTRALSLAVYTLPTFTTASLPEARQGEFYSQALTASGGKPDYFFFVVSGATPGGITLEWNGVLSGIPTGGGSTFTVSVYDANSRFDTRTFTLSVYSPPHITTTSLPDAILDTPYNVTLGYSGGQAPLYWGYSGALPPGLSFGSDGSIFGTPTSVGTWSFTVTLQDSADGLDSRVFPLTVKASPPDGDSLFTVGQWNIEWFGSDTQGPPRSTSSGGALDDLQIANARDVLSDAGVNLWGLAEMVDTADFQTLKAQLPGYNGFLSDDPLVSLGSSYYSPTEQKVGVLYDSRLSLLSAGLILTEADQDFAGRPPLRVDFSTSIHGSNEQLTVIVLHMKAFADQTSYNRRLNAGAALKNYLDTFLPSSRVLVVGDWNDDVDVSITNDTTGNPLPTPYQNFVSAPGAYSFVTRPLSLAGESSTVDFPDMIDHTLASNEVMADYVAGSAHVLHPTWIPDYDGTTSDHYPVLSRYDFGAPQDPLTLTLTGPSSGTYMGGSTLAITWNASPGIGAVWLEYSLDFGATWSWLDTLQDATVGSYLWSVPNVSSSGVLLRITDADTPWRQDTSDTPLTFIYVPSPNRVHVNEFLPNEPSGTLPDGGFGGLVDYEFVEIFNTGPDPVDLSQWTLWDGNTSVGPRHVFSAGTVLQPGKAWVIYGGPTAFTPGTPNTEAASSGRLGLNNSGGDQITLRNAASNLVDEIFYSDTLDNISYNRAVDTDPDTGFVPHNTLGPLPSSAGRRVDGTPF